MILGHVNPYVNVFDHVADRFTANPIEEVHICIITSRTPGNGHVRRYNVPTTNEVTMIIVSELGEVGNHDVIVQRRYGGRL